MRIVLDTNVLVSGIYWKGPPEKILDFWRHQKFKIILTDSIFQEYKRILYKISKGKYDNIADYWFNLISKNSETITITDNVNYCRDPKDDKFIECAILGKAQYIVSGDSDLLDYKNTNKIKIIKPIEFIELLK